MTKATTRIRRPALLGALAAGATFAMLGACLGLLGFAVARAPAPGGVSGDLAANR